MIRGSRSGKRDEHTLENSADYVDMGMLEAKRKRWTDDGTWRGGVDWRRVEGSGGEGRGVDGGGQEMEDAVGHGKSEGASHRACRRLEYMRRLAPARHLNIGGGEWGKAGVNPGHIDWQCTAKHRDAPRCTAQCIRCRRTYSTVQCGHRQEPSLA